MRIVETKVYKFDELSDEAKEKAVNNLYDINVDFNWWEFDFLDAEQIGIKITSFDTYRREIEGRLIFSALECCQSIIKNHGESCDTYKTAKRYIESLEKLENPICSLVDDGTLDTIISVNDVQYRYTLDEDDSEFYRDENGLTKEGYEELCDMSIEAYQQDYTEDIEQEFLNDILEDYLSILSKEYNYKTSEEAIIETIQCNEYEFTEDGNLF